MLGGSCPYSDVPATPRWRRQDLMDTFPAIPSIFRTGRFGK
jgi:hypothetical protein